MLALLVPIAHAFSPTQAEAHALVAGSFRASGAPFAAGPNLDFARLQGLVRTQTDDGQRVAVQTQIEGTVDPVILDALALYAPTDWLQVEAGLQRTWTSELFDILIPQLVFLGRTTPEALLPGRRVGAQATFGAPRTQGTGVAVGAWAPEGAFAGDFREGLVTVVGEHRAESGFLVHGAVAAPMGGDAEAAGEALSVDAAVGYQPKGTRLVAEFAARRATGGAWGQAVALYASHRVADTDLEPAAVLDAYRDDAGVMAGARAALTWHLVPKHVAWTTELGGSRDAAGDLGWAGGTRLMTMF